MPGPGTPSFGKTSAGLLSVSGLLGARPGETCPELLGASGYLEAWPGKICLGPLDIFQPLIDGPRETSDSASVVPSD